MPQTKTFFELVSVESALEKLLDEAAVFIRGNAQCWENAAQQIEEAARNCEEPEKSKWHLIATCFLERAQLHKDLGERLQRY